MAISSQLFQVLAVFCVNDKNLFCYLWVCTAPHLETASWRGTYTEYMGIKFLIPITVLMYFKILMT